MRAGLTHFVTRTKVANFSNEGDEKPQKATHATVAKWETRRLKWVVN